MLKGEYIFNEIASLSFKSQLKLVTHIIHSLKWIWEKKKFFKKIPSSFNKFSIGRTNIMSTSSHRGCDLHENKTSKRLLPSRDSLLH